jgi:hypothetical protein
MSGQRHALAAIYPRERKEKLFCVHYKCNANHHADTRPQFAHGIRPTEMLDRWECTVRRLRVDRCGANVLSSVAGEYRACRWTEYFLLISDKEA